MSKRKILVFGGTGYFGKYLVNLLLERGDEVFIATRSNHSIPPECSFIKFDRSEGTILDIQGSWDVVYDQSCYTSSYLDGVRRIISDCGIYVLTSSQAVYQPGTSICEDSINYNNITSNQNKINFYGLEKLKSENIVRSLARKFIFPRFPVIVGVNDPRRRIQNLIQEIATGHIELPESNPYLQMLDQFDAAKCLFQLPLSEFTGAINISAKEILCAEELCQMIAQIIKIKLDINWSQSFIYNIYDLIKTETKTLDLQKQKLLNIKAESPRTIVERIYSSLREKV